MGVAQMRFVTAREANQGFSGILKQAGNGGTVVITRRGRPVAMLGPYPTPDLHDRELAIEHIVGLMREGIPIGRRFARDEMHERG
jgi:prevent-host-death family protein